MHRRANLESASQDSTAEAASLLRETVDALSRLDAERLEQLANQSHAIAAASQPLDQRSAVEVRALRNTLRALLHTTDANLRVLRQLRHLHLRGISAQHDAETAPWAH